MATINCLVTNILQLGWVLSLILFVPLCFFVSLCSGSGDESLSLYKPLQAFFEVMCDVIF